MCPSFFRHIEHLIFVFVFIIVGTAFLEFIFWAIEKSFDYLKEYFIPTPELPEPILGEIEQEAHDFVWSMHRCEEPDMGDYFEALKYLYDKKCAEYFS